MSEKPKIKEMSIEALQKLNQELTDERAKIRSTQSAINLRIDVLTVAQDLVKKHKIKPDLDSIEKSIVESRMAVK